MPLLCLKCDRRYPDDHVDPCQCGAREWAWVPEPVKPYTLSENDRRMLRQLRISADA